MIQKHLLNVQIQWMMFTKNIDNYNPKRKKNILIVLDDMIADIMANKKFQSIIK